MPYQVLFNAIWELLELEPISTDSGITIVDVWEMLLDSVICYLIGLDTGENPPPDLPHKNEKVHESLDYMVAETALWLDPILEVSEIVDTDIDSRSDCSEEMEAWHCQVELCSKDEPDLDIIPPLLASTPYRDDDNAEPVINIWNLSVRHGLTSIEPLQPWYENDDEELEIPPPIQLLPCYLLYHEFQLTQKLGDVLGNGEWQKD